MVYKLLNGLLSDKKGGAIFTCFGRFHLLFILLTFIAIGSLVLLTKRRKCKENIAKIRAKMLLHENAHRHGKCEKMRRVERHGNGKVSPSRNAIR